MAFVVAVAQRKGGAGKSTVAVNLATALAAIGERVALLDTDPQKTLARWHAAREQAGPRALALDFTDPAGWRVPTALDRLRRASDFIVLDTPPHAETDTRVAIRAADLVLVPLQPTPPDLWAMDGTLDLATGEKRAFVLLLNRVPAQGRLAGEITTALRHRGLPLLEARFGNRTVFAGAFAQGLGVVEAAPGSVAADESRTLALEIRRRAS